MSSCGRRFDDGMQASAITAVPSAPPKFISGEVRRLPGELSDAEQMANRVVQPCNFKLLAERRDVRPDNDLGAIFVPQQTANDRLRLLSISGGTFNGGDPKRPDTFLAISSETFTALKNAGTLILGVPAPIIFDDLVFDQLIVKKFP